MDGKRASKRRLRSRRIAAVLAAGAVLGVGAIGTIAAWTDNEEATGSFGASIFDTESQSAGSPAYASRPTAPGNVLTFNATAMSPGVSSYAYLNIRTTAATTVGGTVALTAITPTGALAPALEYRMVRMASASPTSTCAAAAFGGTPVFIAGGASSYLAVTQVPASPIASTLLAAAGTPLGFCVEVRVQSTAANSYQGATATVQWSFTATSAS